MTYQPTPDQLARQARAARLHAEAQSELAAALATVPAPLVVEGQTIYLRDAAGRTLGREHASLARQVAPAVARLLRRAAGRGHHAVELPPAEAARIEGYRSRDPDWDREAMDTVRARIYIERELVEVSRDGHYRNCLATGTIVYKRRDGQPITDEDEDALLAIPRGQENYVRERTAETITIYYLCDSSD